MSEPLSIYRFTAVWPSWGSNPVSGTIAIPADELHAWAEACRKLGWRGLTVERDVRAELLALSDDDLMDEVRRALRGDDS